LNQALEWFEGRPDEEKASEGSRYDQARTLYVLDRWDDAKTMFAGLHSDIPGNVSYVGYLGAAAARQGEKDEALGISKELEEDERPYLYRNPAYWRARIAAILGDKEGAVNLLRQATKEGHYYSSIHPTEDFESLAGYPPYVQLMKTKG
jgi:predicted Zn-dependent protease